MDNLNLLNALLFIAYWFLELLRAVFGIIFLPFEILFRGYGLTSFEIVPFSRQVISYRWNNLKTFGVTLTLKLTNTSPKLSVRSYDEEAVEASKFLTNTKRQTIQKRIMKGIQESHKYRWVIFQTNETGERFIQLRSDTGYFLFDFPLTPRTLNRDYAIEVIDYLHDHGYYKTSPARMYMNKSYSIDSEGDDLTSIEANLGRDPKTVAEICSDIYKNVLKATNPPEVIFG